MSSGLNSLSAVFLNDFLQLGCNLNMSESIKTMITKSMCVVFGFISFGMVFLMKYLPGILQAAIGLFGMVGGPLLGVFSLGMFVPWATTAGALSGFISSLIFVFWWGFGQIVANMMGTYDRARFSPLKNTSVAQCPESWSLPVTTPVSSGVNDDMSSSFTHLALYDVSYIWYGPVSLVMCLIIGVLISLYKPTDHKHLDRRLVSPAFTTFFCWTPGCVRRRIQQYYSEIGSLNKDSVTRSENMFSGEVNVGYISAEKGSRQNEVTYKAWKMSQISLTGSRGKYVVSNTAF